MSLRAFYGGLLLASILGLENCFDVSRNHLSRGFQTLGIRNKRWRQKQVSYDVIPAEIRNYQQIYGSKFFDIAEKLGFKPENENAGEKANIGNRYA